MAWQRDYAHEQAIRQAVMVGAGMGADDEWPGEAPKAYRKGLLNALVSRDEIARGDLRWHVSLTGPGRCPTWEELVAAGHGLRPGIVFVIGLPPKSWWINVHPDCLHLYETKDEALIAQWRAERRGDRPT
jgi:hypothetical protein